MEVAEVRERDAAVVAVGHLADVVLEALERIDAALRDLLAVAQDAAGCVARDPAVENVRPGDRRLAVDLVDASDLGPALGRPRSWSAGRGP